jgi:DNA-binding transcriptional ArsR family regulator
VGIRRDLPDRICERARSNGRPPDVSLLPSATDPRVLKAFAHPLRFRVLDLLERHTASPSDLAVDLGERVDLLAYHIRQLALAGLVSMVRVEAKRGALEHYYAATGAPTMSDSEWGSVPDLVRKVVLASALKRVGPELDAAGAGFGREGAMCVELPLKLDDEDWATVGRAMLGTLARLEGLGRDGDLPRIGAETTPRVSAVAVMMLLRRGAPAEQRRRAAEVSLCDPRIVKACVNPMRGRLLDLLIRQDMTAKSAARALDRPIAAASYHLTRLAQLGLAHTERRRNAEGVLERAYTLRMSPTLVNSWGAQVGSADLHTDLKPIAAHVFGAARDGGFDHEGAHYTRTALLVDPGGWNAAAAQLRSLRDRVSALHGSSKAACAPGKFVASPATVVLMLFERGVSTDPGECRPS